MTLTGAAGEPAGAEWVLFVSYLPFFPLAVPVQAARVHPGPAGRQAVRQAPHEGKGGAAGGRSAGAGVGAAQPALLARLHGGPGDGLVQVRGTRGTPPRRGGVSELPTALEAVVRWDSALRESSGQFWGREAEEHVVAI